MENKISLSDLLSNLNSKNGNSEQKFATMVQNDRNKKVQAVSKKQEQRMKRQSNYNYVKEDMDKWVGIVKVNREKETLNFENKDHDHININFFPQKPLNNLQKSIDSKLQKMNLHSQKVLLKEQKSILGQLDEEQAKHRLRQARKHRQLVFNEEQKRRRISKIKSKVYRKIKKRQRMREEEKNIQNMDAEQKAQYIEKVTKRRVKERITLKHKTKSKYIEKLIRFGKNSKKNVQDSINEINEIRKKQTQRIDQQLLDNISQEYDDDNFDKQELIKQLQAQIQAKEKENLQQEDVVAGDLNFRKRAKEIRNNQTKQQAKRLLRKLQNQDSMVDESQQQYQSQKQKEKEEEEEGFINRKVYGQNLKEQPKVQNNKGIEDKMKQYLSYQDTDKLTQGININKLKDKYNPQRVNIDLRTLIAQNKEIYQQDNQAVMENIREFQQEKVNEYENQLQVDQKNKGKSKGWGSWAGPGITQKKVDEKEELRKKIQKIQQLKRKRKDGALAHVTINQSRNKNLSDYLVRDLPHNFSNADQFDYLQNSQIGPQWNSLNQFKDNIKPKVKTKAGQVIQPVKLPKSMKK